MVADRGLSPTPMPSTVEVRRIDAGETRPLRHAVLRPSETFDATVYAGDDDLATRHLGAFVDGRLVGVASLYREDRPDREGGSDSDREGRGEGAHWRLRGMATAPEARGRGAGRALLDACVNHVAAKGGGLLWCNARTPAVGFYTAAGFRAVGDEFDIADIGPHVVMLVPVPPSS